MEILRKYKIVIAVVMPILILVLVRLLNPNHFKPDAGRWASPSIEQMNLIGTNSLETLAGEKLIIIIDQSEIEGFIGKTIKISPDSIIKRQNLKTLRNHAGPIVLYSGDQSLSARIWMVLSQLGIRDLYILTADKDNEVLKYKFRPDTMTGPEL